jgi:hypothetical protein
MTERTDQKFHYIEILVKDLAPDQVSIRIEDGQITVSGKVEKKTQSSQESGEEEGHSVTMISSSFEKSFPGGMECAPPCDFRVWPNWSGTHIRNAKGRVHRWKM